MSRYCKNCNSVLIDDAIICFSCGMRCEYKIKKVGTKIEVEPIEPETVNPPAKPVEVKEPVKEQEVVKPVEQAKPVEVQQPAVPEKPVSAEKPEKTPEPVKPAEQKKPVSTDNTVKPSEPKKTEEKPQEKVTLEIQKMNPIKYFGLIGVGAAAFVFSIIVVIVMIVAIGFSGPQIAVRQFERAVNSINMNPNNLAPKDAWQYIVEDDYYGIDQGKKAVLQENYNENLGTWKRSYGSSAKADLKIVENKKVNRYELRQISSSLYSQYRISTEDVKKANELHILVTIKGDYASPSYQIRAYAVKIENSWYIIYYNTTTHTVEFALNNAGYSGWYGIYE